MLASILDLKKLCQANAHIAEPISIELFSRLKRYVQEEFELSAEQLALLQIEVRLDFSFNQRHQRLIQGQVLLSLPAICQRCLTFMVLSLLVPIHLVQWSMETAPKDDLLPTGFDWLVHANDLINLADLLEDDLLLAVPTAPIHEPNSLQGACDAEILKQLAQQDTPEPRKQVESTQFFQALSALKAKGLGKKS